MIEASAPGVATPKRTRLNYRPDIDGIRGIAAIGVMGFHAKVPGLEGGFIGLDLFFVLSGYVITNLLLNEYDRTGSIKWGAFYARRARRLIPAKATMLLGVLVLSYFLLTPLGAQQETARSAAAAAGFVSNFFFWQNADVSYFGHQPGTGVLLHTWSLSVEEQFYLMLPLVLIAALVIARLFRFDVRRILLVGCLALTAGSIYLAVALADNSPQAAYYLPFSRAYEFLLGVALSLVAAKVTLPQAVREVLGAVGLALIAYCMIWVLPTEGYPDLVALVPCAAAVLLVWAGCGADTLATRLLKFPLFVWLGLLSYGWYLWHWPLLVLGESVNLAPPPLAVRVGLIMLGLLIAWLSYRFVEGIFYSRGGAKSTVNLKPRTAILSGVTAMALVASLSGGAYALARHQSGEPEWTAVQGQLDDVPRMPESCAAPEELIPQKPGACELTPYDADRPTVVLWGDSHAWMFIPALQEAVAERDVNLVAFVMGACPPLDPQLPKGKGARRGIACEANNDQALSYVTELAREKAAVQVVLGASWERYRGIESPSLMDQRAPNPGSVAYIKRIRPLFDVGTPRLFRTLGELGVPVDVIAPTVGMPRNPPLCLALPRPYSCDVAAGETAQPGSATRAWLQEQMAALGGEPRLIDVNNELCDESTCHVEVGDTVTYFDDQHLSASFVRSLEHYFVPTVEGVL
ncbi:MAG: acyltransferase family protein [Nocardioides sp.]|nr:acyltransferase family protein [Nocardioides sp.]